METGNWKIGKECQMKIQKTKMTVQTGFFLQLMPHRADHFHSQVPPAARIPLLLIQMHWMKPKVPAGS